MAWGNKKNIINTNGIPDKFTSGSISTVADEFEKTAITVDDLAATIEELNQAISAAHIKEWIDDKDPKIRANMKPSKDVSPALAEIINKLGK